MVEGLELHLIGSICFRMQHFHLHIIVERRILRSLNITCSEAKSKSTQWTNGVGWYYLTGELGVGMMLCSCDAVNTSNTCTICLLTALLDENIVPRTWLAGEPTTNKGIRGWVSHRSKWCICLPQTNRFQELKKILIPKIRACKVNGHFEYQSKTVGFFFFLSKMVAKLWLVQVWPCLFTNDSKATWSPSPPQTMLFCVQTLSINNKYVLVKS